MNKLFAHFANVAAMAAGHPSAFLLAVAAVLIWGVTGPVFGFSETWQLVINTGTTIITFLVVFMIQNTQNRDSRAVHLKLDEIIRVLEHARNDLVDIEDKDDELIERYQAEFKKLEDVID